MSQNQQTPASQKPQSDDPLASLHRMSTTAGVASSEYVAINLPSVAALLLGLASGTVLMANVMMVVPLLAILVGILAIRQVNNSNGTQTGRAMAILGILLAVATVAFVGFREVQARNAVKAEEGKVFALVEEFSKAMLAKEYSRTPTFFTAGFFDRKKLSQQAVAERWGQLADGGPYGSLKAVETNGRVLLSGEPGQAGRNAETMLVFRFDKAETPLRRGAALRKDDDGQWKIDDVPDLFPTPADPSRGAAGAPTNVMPR